MPRRQGVNLGLREMILYALYNFEFCVLQLCWWKHIPPYSTHNQPVVEHLLCSNPEGLSTTAELEYALCLQENSIQFHLCLFFRRSGITSERSVIVTYALSKIWNFTKNNFHYYYKNNITKETRLYSPKYLTQSMLLLGPHIPFLHQVLQLISLEANLACHYIWLPNT